MAEVSNGTPSRSLVVGIAGGSASGKSTLATALTSLLEGGAPPLRVQTILTDTYFDGHAPDAPVVRLPGGEEHFDCNSPTSVNNARLTADLDRLTRGPDAPDVLLVEGLMVLHQPEIRRRLDLRLYVELEADLRALRRLVRNLGPESPVDLDKARFIQDYYCASAHVGHKAYVEPSRIWADLILRGDGDFDRLAPMVAAVVRERLPVRALPEPEAVRSDAMRRS